MTSPFESMLAGVLGDDPAEEAAILGGGAPDALAGGMGQDALAGGLGSMFRMLGGSSGPTATEEAVEASYDPITARLIDDTPGVMDIMEAVTSMQGSNPLALMKGGQPVDSKNSMPTMIARANIAAQRKSEAATMAVLNDAQGNQIKREQLVHDRTKLGFDMMNEAAIRGDEAAGAMIKDLNDLHGKVPGEQWNRLNVRLQEQIASDGLPRTKADGSMRVLKALAEQGGAQDKPADADKAEYLGSPEVGADGKTYVIRKYPDGRTVRQPVEDGGYSPAPKAPAAVATPGSEVTAYEDVIGGADILRANLKQMRELYDRVENGPSTTPEQKKAARGEMNTLIATVHQTLNNKIFRNGVMNEGDAEFVKKAIADPWELTEGGASASAFGFGFSAPSASQVTGNSWRAQVDQVGKMVDQYEAAAEERGARVGVKTRGLRNAGGPSNNEQQFTKVEAAFIQQESGGNPKARSVQNARGRRQITLPLFEQYADIDENFDSARDVEAVSERAFRSVYDKHRGNVEKVAVEWFSGSGNVNPNPTGTPWLRDKSDANGKSVSSYVANIRGRLNPT